MLNKEIRRQNLLILEKEFRTLEALARKTETTAAHLSQVKNKFRGMGDKIARRIESALQKPSGWMDAMHREIEGSATIIRPPLTAKEEVLLELIRGLTAQQQDELLPSIRAAFDANRMTQKHLQSKLQTIGNARIEQDYGFPKKIEKKTKKGVIGGRPPGTELDDFPGE